MLDANNTTSGYGVLESYLPENKIGVFWCSFLALQGLLITVLNFLTIVTFMINSHLRKRSTYGIVNLAVADVFVGAVSIPLNVYLLGLFYSFWGQMVPFPYELFIIQNTVYLFTGMASLFALVLISLERVLATVFPLRHRTTSSLMYVFGVGITWMLAAVVAAVWICSFLYANLEVSLYLWMPCLLLSLVIICSAYIGVYVSVKLHNTRQQNTKARAPFQREKELAVTLFIVAAISLLCWVPFCVVQIINFKGGDLLSLNIIYAAIAIANANSLVNPIIYVFRMQSFRYSLYYLITKCSHDRRQRKRSCQSFTDGLISSRRRTTNNGSSYNVVNTVL